MTLSETEAAWIEPIADELSRYRFTRERFDVADVTRVFVPVATVADGEYRIRAYRLDEVKDKVAKLARRAERLGLPAPTFEVVREEEAHVVVTNGYAWTFTGAVQSFVVVRPSTAPIALDGWSFAATIEHLGDAGNILRAHPAWAAPLPASYREDAPTCDHCRVARYRLETFVVHKDGEYRRVGRQCLADYIGDASASRIVAMATIDRALSDALGDDWSGSGGMYAACPEHLLAATAFVIQKFGWLSRKVARDTDRASSADTAWSLIFPPPQPDSETRRLLAEAREALPGFADEARAALAWARDIPVDTTSDYLHNLRVVAGVNAWDHRKAGLGASILMAYQKEQERLKRMEFARALPSVGLPQGIGFRFGAPKKGKTPATVPLRARVLGVHTFEGNYGPTTVVRLQAAADDGRAVHDVVWFASGGDIQVTLDAQALKEHAAADRAWRAVQSELWLRNDDETTTKANALRELCEEARERAAGAARSVKAGDLVDLTGTIKKLEASRKTNRMQSVMSRCSLTLAHE